MLLPAVVVVSGGCTANRPQPPSQTAPALGAPSPGAPSLSTPTQTVPATPARSGCGSPVDTGPLPEWARAGFTGDSSMPHVLSDHGTIVAAMFGHPLAVTRPDGSSNKILWVAKDPTPPGDLQIDATRTGTQDVVRRTVPGGPGPSIIDLPQPGCWRLTLTWPAHTDTLDLTYQP
ncbi:hypothetical protein GCM10009827_048580 [Dactylosporangium maewongense]|uniref:Uncharacterized protein n=1 Tax=Dactylosporangium maewongense TaxID=634393 RepID=A0ABN2ASU4_9ACTN